MRAGSDARGLVLQRDGTAEGLGTWVTSWATACCTGTRAGGFDGQATKKKQGRGRHSRTEDARETSVKQGLSSLWTLVNTRTHACTAAGRRSSRGQGPSPCSLLLSAEPSTHPHPLSRLPRPPLTPRNQPPLAQGPCPGVQGRAGLNWEHEKGVGAGPQDAAIVLPGPAQSRSAAPHGSPEARTGMFIRAHPRPSQLFPKKGPSLQENSSNQLSKK